MNPCNLPGRSLALCISAAVGLFASSHGHAQELAAEFDDSFLHQGAGQPSVDLSIFALSNRVLPGLKSVVLRINGQLSGMREIDFIAVPGKENAQPCLSTELLEGVGVNLLAFPSLVGVGAPPCTSLLEAIPSASSSYDFDRNILSLSIPQAALSQSARGAVSPEMWDTGETAFWSSYHFSHNQMRISGEGRSTNRSSFLSLRNGLNLGAWRLRANGNFYDSNGSSSFTWNDFYAERDVAAWRGWLRLGDSSTSGQIFTSTRFRGVQLQSDDGMLPDSMRGYAPVVRGVAAGNAKVTIRQNGYVIYTTFVAAGPFVINDLYSTPGGGDLEVEVEELNGRTTRFFQPFSALPTMVREGIWNYNFSLGQHRQSFGDEKPLMGMATLAYGLPYGLTAYGGLTTAQGGYHAGAIGLAINMRALGALSLDMTSSRSRQQDGGKLVGTAARIQYAKSFAESGTDLTLASYRYNSSGYRSLDDALRDRNDSTVFRGLQRQQEYQLSFAQRIGDMGSLSFNYFGLTYRNAEKKAEYMQVGYSSAVGRIGYSVNLGRNSSPQQERQTTVMLTLSLPLGGSHTASYSMNHTSGQGTSHDVNLSGALTDDYAVTYALQAGMNSGNDRGGHGYGSVGYASPVGIMNVSHAYARNSSNTNFDFSGAVVVDGKGPLFGQSLGETAIVVDAPGAADVQVESFPGVRTDSNGRALIPYVSPYRENRISLAPDYDDATATIQQNVQTVVPTRGAIAVAYFETAIGRTVIATLRSADGKVLPFGASIYDDDGEQRGVVGPVGRSWLTGLQGRNHFLVKWGEQQELQCTFEIDVSAAEQGTDKVQKEFTCA